MLSDLEALGGAAIAASRLAAGLERAGHEVWRLVLQPALADGEAPRVRRLGARRAPERLASALPVVRRAVRGVVARSALRDALHELAPDVVNVHNIHYAVTTGGWSIEHVVECVRAAPTVWTLHDMWSFTGRCAYNGGCTAHLRGCRVTCPTPRQYPPLARWRIPGAWRAKRRLLAAPGALVGVAPSRWLASEAAASGWRGRRVEVIPYGLLLDEWRPHPQAAAREALQVPRGAPVVLLVASELDDPRKGIDLALEALRLVRARPLTLLAMGAPPVRLDIPGIRVVNLGPISSVAVQTLAYSASDLLVHAAREDNLPNTVLEALACGAPVLAFRAGGLPDAVRPGETGWLAEEVSAVALARTLEDALRSPPTEALRASCRAVAEAEYDAALQATRYERLFSELRAVSGRR